MIEDHRHICARCPRPLIASVAALARWVLPVPCTPRSDNHRGGSPASAEPTRRSVPVSASFNSGVYASKSVKGWEGGGAFVLSWFPESSSLISIRSSICSVV